MEKKTKASVFFKKRLTKYANISKYVNIVCNTLQFVLFLSDSDARYYHAKWLSLRIHSYTSLSKRRPRQKFVKLSRRFHVRNANIWSDKTAQRWKANSEKWLMQRKSLKLMSASQILDWKNQNAKKRAFGSFQLCSVRLVLRVLLVSY